MIKQPSVLLHARPLMLLYVLLIVPIAGDTTPCPSNCSGHGTCQTDLGKCVCRRGFTGEDCGSVDYACPHNCAGHGYCDGIKCVCDEGYHGRDCGKALNYACPSNCAGRGTCIFGQCACNPGFTGAACDVPTFSNGCAHNCSGGGWCGGGSCVCAAGLGGPACERVTNPTKRGCPHGCTGHGQCKCSSTAPGSLCACQCDPGWSGPGCERFDLKRERCPNGCSGHGVCVRGQCVCDTLFEGKDCSRLKPSEKCLDGCSGRGECRSGPKSAGALPGVRLSANYPYQYQMSMKTGAWRFRPHAHNESRCICHDGSGGPTCLLAMSIGPNCPSACSGHGLCHDGGCKCEEGYGGDDCGVVCPGGCGGHGTCNEEGTCVCEAGRWGARCEIESPCLNGCSGRGVCAPASDANATAIAAVEHAATAARLSAAARAAATMVEEAWQHAEVAVARADAAKAAAVAAAVVRCHCAPGWGGADDCSVRDDGCFVGCGGHGECVSGECVCQHGWRGERCEIEDGLARRAMLGHHGLLGFRPKAGSRV